MNMIKTVVYFLRLINQFLEEKKNTQEQPKPGAVNLTWKVFERVCLGEVPSYYLRSHWRVNFPPKFTPLQNCHVDRAKRITSRPLIPGARPFLLPDDYVVS